MAVAYRSSTSNSVTQSTSSTLSAPSGLVDNDILLYLLYIESSTTVTWPSGFTQKASLTAADSSFKVYVAWKRAASESGTYSPSWGSNAWRQGVLLAISGAITTGDPFDVAVGTNAPGSETNTLTLASITTATANSLVIAAGATFASLGATPTAPSGHTLRFGANGEAWAISDALKVTAGSTGSLQFTGASATGQTANLTLAIKPPASSVPNAPTLNSASGGNTQVALSWTAPASGATPTGYKVRRGTSTGTYGTTIDVGNVTSYTNTGLTNSTTYYFVIAGYNGSGDGTNSNELSATPSTGAPSAPTLSTATAGNAQVALTWTTVSGATGYKIKYGTSTGTYTTTVDVAAVTSYSVTGLGNGTLYYFAVVAYNGSGDSANSNELSATPQSGSTPNAPVFNSLVGTSTQLTASWSTVPNATGYKVKYGTVTGTYTTTLTVGNVTTYNITALTNGTRYFVVIVPYNASGDGGASNELNASPAATSFIKTKYNDISNGDILLFEQLFEIEAMTAGTHPSPDSGKIYKSVTVNGVNGYEFSVTRNVDGTGKNTWPAGSAYVNTGQAGSGFIDQYSYASVSSRPFEFINDGATPIDPMSVDFAVLTGAASTLYFGVANTKWDGLFLNITTPAIYTTATIVYEYWNGAWVALTSTVSATDASNVAVTADLKTAGRHSVVFTAPADWATTTIVGQAAYWIRMRVSAATGWTQNPRHGGNKWATRGKRQYGSTIAFMRRNSATWNDFAARAVVGNLEGYYDYGTTAFGLAAGDFAGTWISADTLNGFRVMNANTTLGKWDTSGNITIGNPASANTYISAGVMKLRLGSTEVINFDAGSGSAYFNAVVTISSTGEIRQGTGTLGSNYTGLRIWNSSGIGLIAGYNSNVVQWQAGTDGKLYAGGGNVMLDANGISVAAQWSGYTSDRAYKFTSPNNSSAGVYAFYSAYSSSISLRNYTVSGVSNYVAVESNAVGTADAQSTVGAYNSVGSSYVNVTSLSGIAIYTTSGNISYYPAAGRNYFQDSELSTGTGLRVGAAWGMYGIYAESGYCVVGGASGVNLQNGVVQITSGVGILRSSVNNTTRALAISGGMSVEGANGGYKIFARDDADEWTIYATGDNLRFYYGGSDMMRVDVLGRAWQGNNSSSWSTTSDMRIKTMRGDYRGGLAEILRIRPVEYEFNGHGGFKADGKRHVGVIAQEIAAVLPDTVYSIGRVDDIENMLAVDPSEIVWALVNAVKDLSQKVAALEASNGTRY